MTLDLRRATRDDADALCNLLNPIIAAGGTTAHQAPFNRQRMIDQFIEAPLGICCTLAEKQGLILGFQALERADPNWPGDDKVPSDWALIATFVAPHAAGQGVGRALFNATIKAAEKAGILTIDATIRADNAIGLGYYAAMGFRDYARLANVPLKDGTPVDRIRKRFDLAKT